MLDPCNQAVYSQATACQLRSPPMVQQGLISPLLLGERRSSDASDQLLSKGATPQKATDAGRSPSLKALALGG